MAITEVYKNPTVKEVVFQVLFPSFFSIENKIGEYQLLIMERFPKSTLLLKNQILFAQTSTKAKHIENDQGVQVKKIWQFKTEEEDVIVNITSDSLDIKSTKHKTYNNESSSIKFRDTIGFIVENFLKLIPLFKISRIGLRYIDNCPLPKKLSIETFLEYYNSYINFSKINKFQNILVVDFMSIIDTNDIIIRYKEVLQKVGDEYIYELDFDGQKTDIKPDEYLIVLDKIHQEVANCYEKIIKEPVIKYMRNEP